MTALLVVLGGAAGAPLRYLVDRWVTARVGGVLPWGTLTVNVAGSFLLGILAATGPEWLRAIGGVGLCGALTTFSTFSFETVELLDRGRVGPAAVNVAGSLCLGLVAAGLGWWLAG